MALDFHRLDNNEYLFGLDDRQFQALFEVFETFRQWTGLVIDQYDDLKLTPDNQQTLIKVIDKYIDSTDLNKDKQKTSTILEFKGIMSYFSKWGVDIKLVGD
jgi:hypothetical protein